MTEREIWAWCVECGARHTKEECLGAMSCPTCGSEGIPCSPTNDVEIKINWHELRILTIWAENFAAAHSESDPRMTKTVKAIAKRIQEQFPSRISLTLSGELAELGEKYDIEVFGSIQPDDDAKPPRQN
jgi:hypothetical protein